MVVYADNHPTINLFGFEESQLHHIHNTVELHRNIFLVKFNPEEPNNIEWINCPLAATYKYQESRGRRVESMFISSFQDLQAKVPVNYARFSGYVKNGKALEFNYVTIGSYELLSDFRIPKDDPDCANATHYVVTLSVGAFNFAESKQIEGGVEVEEKTTGVGVGASAGRSSGETTSVGDLDACMDDKAALNGCFTPLQLMMMPLAARHWGTGEAEAVAPTGETRTASADTGSGSEQAPSADTQETVAADLSLKVDQEAWPPGFFMATALEQILVMATRIDVTTDFGFDDMGSAVAAGYLEPNKPQYLNRQFEGGKTYAVIGASATGSNVDLVVTDGANNLVVSDTQQDGQPVVTFDVPETGQYSIQLSVVGVDAEFGAIVIMEDGGSRISPEVLQHVFQRLLNTGSNFAEQALEKFGAGLVFHEADWAVQGTILYPGETIRQRGIDLSAAPAVFTAVSHEDGLDINIQVLDSNSGQEWLDTEVDSNPLVFIEQPQADTKYEFAVTYPAGTSEDGTLATSLLLRFEQ